MQQQSKKQMLVTVTTDIVTAQISSSTVQAAELPTLIENVYRALAGLGAEPEEEEKLEPAVSIKASVKSDHIVCLEDGKKMKMLKRHLLADHGMTPEEYRERWGLPSEYPMVAPAYAEMRRELARKIGLGLKRDQRRGAGNASK